MGEIGDGFFLGWWWVVVGGGGCERGKEDFLWGRGRMEGTGMGFLIWHNDISHTLATRIELVGLE